MSLLLTTRRTLSSSHCLSKRSIRFSSSASSPSSFTIPRLIGSAPEYSRHLVIHTPHASNTWPSHLESVSPLYRELGKRFGSEARYKGMGFGMSEGGPLRQDGSEVEKWDPNRSKFDSPETKESSQEEVYSATLYPDFKHFPSFSISSLPSFEKVIDSLPSTPSPSSPSPSSSSSFSSTTLKPRTHIYVCTHGSRDCKCGDLGEKLYQSILLEVERRKLGGELSSTSESRQEGVRISRIAHIGGHKFAANALVYRELDGKCDWYGLLNESDVNDLLDDAISTRPETDTTLYSNWRGRLGLSSDATKAQYSSSTSTRDKKKQVQELGEKVEIKFVTFDGDELNLVGYEGESLMQVAKRGDAPSILATCGGNCECATCHVHIRPLESTTTSSSSSSTPSAETRQPTAIPELPSTLPEMTDEEDEQLDFAIGADDDSRLACQIPVTRELGEWIKRGGRIHLPRY
ncbi:hypothetical protein JCM5350_000556 [Sporobolomyces pararoseus]